VASHKQVQQTLVDRHTDIEAVDRRMDILAHVHKEVRASALDQELELPPFPLARLLLTILEQREEERQQRHEAQTAVVVVRHAEALSKALDLHFEAPHVHHEAEHCHRQEHQNAQAWGRTLQAPPALHSEAM